MSSRIFQNVIIQMKDSVDRTLGVVDEQGFVPVVVLTHPAAAKAVDAAIAEIRESGVLSEDPVKLRML